MTYTEVVDIYGPDEDWIIELPKDTEYVNGRFVANALGKPLYFQTTNKRIIFMAWIVSAQRIDDREAKPSGNPWRQI